MINIKIPCPVSSLSCLCITKTSKQGSTGMDEMVELCILRPMSLPNRSWKEVEGFTTSTSLSITHKSQRRFYYNSKLKNDMVKATCLST
jgi:hypothetical protein